MIEPLFSSIETQNNSQMGMGRQKGSKNRTTKEIREAIRDIVNDELDNFYMSLERVRSKNPEKYALIIIRLMDMVVPKAQEVEITNASQIDIEGTIKKIQSDIINGEKNT